MLQRLPITLAQVKAGNTPKKSLNKNKQFVCSLRKKKKKKLKTYIPISWIQCRYNTNGYYIHEFKN